jgi:hypothetical protein
MINTNTTNLDTTQNNRITACENINTSQGTSITSQGISITALQQKTTAVAYTTPVAGALTTLTSSLDLQPYLSSTFLKVYNINNQAITCLGQAIFAGLGLITTRLQLTNFGTVMTGLSFGSSLSVLGNNTVNFPVSTFQGTVIPKVFISQSDNGKFSVVSKTVTGFVYSASSAGVNIDWVAMQSL